MKTRGPRRYGLCQRSPGQGASAARSETSGALVDRPRVAEDLAFVDALIRERTASARKRPTRIYTVRRCLPVSPDVHASPLMYEHSFSKTVNSDLASKSRA